MFPPSGYRHHVVRHKFQKGVDSMDAYIIHFFHLELKVIHASITQNKRGSTCADASEAKYGFSQKLADKS